MPTMEQQYEKWIRDLVDEDKMAFIRGLDLEGWDRVMANRTLGIYGGNRSELVSAWFGWQTSLESEKAAEQVRRRANEATEAARKSQAAAERSAFWTMIAALATLGAALVQAAIQYFLTK